MYKHPEQIAAELREALKPFADFAEPTVPPEFVITQGSAMAKRQLTMGDCQRAYELLNEENEDGT